MFMSVLIVDSLADIFAKVYDGRTCAENPLADGPNPPRCCIPCPVFDWTYGDNFKSMTDGAAWVNVAGFILCGFLLISSLVLPANLTRRSYLNITLLGSVMLLELAFIIPLARQPPQCWDPITPNGMHSNLTCAFSGALFAFGLLAYMTWILIRALFMHLQICWNITPGNKSYIAADITAWGLIIGLTAATLARTGVSFRFGGYCYINVHSEATYWGWVLGFGVIALLLQLATCAYCIEVYVAAALAGRQHLTSTSNKSSIAKSSRSHKAMITLDRVKKVLIIQWRSIAIIFLAIFAAAFICTVYIYLDNKLTLAAFHNTDILIPWLICILTTQQKNQCLQYTSKWIVSEAIAVATMFLIGFIGISAFFLLYRGDVSTGWWNLIRRKEKTRPEAVRASVSKRYQRDAALEERRRADREAKMLEKDLFDDESTQV